MISAEQVRNALTKYAKAHEISEASTFFCYRNHDLLKVYVCDSGIEGDNYRYFLRVFRDGKEVGRGNGGPTIDTAIAVFHWSALDTPSE